MERLTPYELDKKLLPWLIKVERRGLKVNVPQAFQEIENLTALESDVKNKLLENHALKNHRSPKQCLEAFANQGIKLTSSGEPVLKPLAARGNTLAKLILECRKLSNLKSKFLIPILEHTGNDGILHTTFNQDVTKTGRLSSSDPNIQNLKRVEEDDPYSSLIRGLFVPRDGMYYAGADYDQMEMRLNALISGDPTLLQLFREGTKDIYVDIAKLIWPGETISKFKRWSAKQTVLGLSFGMGVKKSVEQWHKHGYDMTYDHAHYIREIFHQRFPYIKLKIDELSAAIRKVGYVEDAFGRRYHVPTDLCYKAYNAVVQGTAAGLMKRAFILLCEVLEKKFGSHAYVVNTIHDEFLTEFHERIPRALTNAEIVECMEEPGKIFDIPLTAEAKHYEHNWAA